METSLSKEFKIQTVKKVFEKKLSEQLQLHKVSSPLMVMDGTGINDDLNGTERPVRFAVKAMNDDPAVVVHSLAKWKRIRLQEYKIPIGQGILTDMHALRPDEDYSPIHSIFVDQWDWEKHIDKNDRSLDYLKYTVKQIFKALKQTEKKLVRKGVISEILLPKKIKFIQSEELLQRYPSLSPKEREHKIAEEFGAVFIIGIGSKLSTGDPHDGRAADYDDWSTTTKKGTGLNGDLLVWHPILGQSLELSSMGIRVDKKALEKQLLLKEEQYKSVFTYHQKILKEELPFSIGGGIGQSRVCLFFLQKQHIGEVQSSVWSNDIKEELKEKGIQLI